jgi:hypothetical protein
VLTSLRQSIINSNSFAGGEQIIAKGEFTSNDVHKQYGIGLRSPAYVNKDIEEPVLCSMYLYRPKNQAKSEPVDFTFYPRKSVSLPNYFQSQFCFLLLPIIKAK